jgi:thiol:disulfide interchange protein
LAAVVFVMSLSFMGVWEVPLPVFLGGGKTGALASQEGMAGAYFKGVLTTFLATPCSAPLLAPAVAWATSQPTPVTLSVFMAAGLGMASPYLLIGAFPALVRFLPKPGVWMETFKQFMGFVLMGTVVYLLAVLKPHYVVPTVGILFSLGLTCWMVGRVGPERELGVKIRTWVLAAAIVGIAWIVMFPGLDEHVIGSFHFDGLAKATAPKEAPAPTEPSKRDAPRIVGPKPVLVDFTATWCVNCHIFENKVLNTTPVVDAIRKNGVIALKADWSNRDPNVSAMLDALASRVIPVIAIFSPHDPNHPRVFRGGYTQQDILDALQWASQPSQAVAAVQ